MSKTQTFLTVLAVVVIALGSDAIFGKGHAVETIAITALWAALRGDRLGKA